MKPSESQNEKLPKAYVIGSFVDPNELSKFDKIYRNYDQHIKKMSTTKSKLIKKEKKKSKHTYSQGSPVMRSNSVSLTITNSKKTSLSNDYNFDKVYNGNVEWDIVCRKFLGKSLESLEQLKFPGYYAKDIFAKGGLIGVLSPTGDLYMTASKHIQQNEPFLLCSEKKLNHDNFYLTRERALSSIKEFSIGYNHVAVSCLDGSCWVWGKNTNQKNEITGQLGSDIIKKSALPIKLEVNEITKVSVGDTFTILLNIKGRIISFGSNQLHQLGRDVSNFDHIPNFIPNDLNFNKIIQISCGSQHVLAKSKQNDLFAWGDNSFVKSFFF